MTAAVLSGVVTSLFTDRRAVAAYAYDRIHTARMRLEAALTQTRCIL